MPKRATSQKTRKPRKPRRRWDRVDSARCEVVREIVAALEAAQLRGAPLSNRDRTDIDVKLWTAARAVEAAYRRVLEVGDTELAEQIKRSAVSIVMSITTTADAVKAEAELAGVN